MRRLFLLSVGMLMLIGAPFAAVGSAAQAGTKVVLFSPWRFGRLVTTLHAGHQVAGHCFARAESTSRADAWRCSARDPQPMNIQGKIYQVTPLYDPCFSGSYEHGAQIVACVNGPFARSVTLLRVGDLPTLPPPARPPTDGAPWAIVLADGLHCTFVGGATGTVAGMRMNYSCSNGKTWLLGNPQRTSGTWTIYEIAAPDDPNAVQVGLATAYY